MNRRKAVKALAAAATAVVARPARAASPAAAVYVKRWNQAKTFTLLVADAMPPEHYEFKPQGDQMTFGKLMTHLSAANTAYFSRIKGEAAPMKEPPNADKETAKKYIAESFDWCAGILGSLTEEDLAKSYPGRTPQQAAVTGRDLVLNGFIHTAHTRGYAEVYMRVKGLVPPRYSV